jgi:LysR family glycine cleavage system transcriptional activator
MQKLPLAALRAFAAVYETGGVRTAARSLGVTHSAVSRHLRELESWIGIALLAPRRGNAAIALTPQGHALGKAALSGLAELERAVMGARELRPPHSVVVAATASFASRWLIPRLASLTRQAPWIELSIATDQQVRGVTEQGADLAVRMGVGPWVESAGEPLMDDALFPVATRRYWQTLRERQPARAVAKARLLHDRDPAAGWERWFGAYPSRGVDLRVGARFTSSDLVLQAAAQGFGVALARARFAGEDLAAGKLIRPFGAAQVELPQAYWLVHEREAAAKPAVATVIDWLRAEAAGS